MPAKPKDESPRVDVEAVSGASIGRVDASETGLPTRFYRDRLGAFLIALFMATLVLLLAGVAAAPFFWVGRVVCAGLAIALAVITTRLVRRFGVGVSDWGICINGASVRRSIPWSEIKAFRTASWGPYESVLVELESSQLLRTPLMQGRKMTCGDLQTRDVMQLLDEHLATARHAH